MELFVKSKSKQIMFYSFNTIVARKIHQEELKDQKKIKKSKKFANIK